MAKEKFSFQDLVEAAGYECRSYSGRAMYGKSCLGVVIPFDTLGQFIADLWEQMEHNTNVYRDDELQQYCESASAAFRSMRTDDMGKHDMIVYFKDVEYEEDDEKEENDDQTTDS